MNDDEKPKMSWFEKLILTVGVVGLYAGLAWSAPVYVSPPSVNGATISSATITDLNASYLTVTGTATIQAGTVRLGTTDDSGRKTIQNYGTSSILKLGSSDADSASDSDADSEGIVVYHPTSNTAARIKAERFGLTKNSDQTQYYFKVDEDEFFHSSAPLTVGGTTAPGAAGTGQIEARAAAGSLGGVTARSGSQFSRLFATSASNPGLSWLSGTDFRIGEGSLDAGSFSEFMRIVGTTGRLGLNDTTADAQLDIKSNQAPAGYILSISSQSDTTGDIVSVLGNGDVGIGIVSANAKLQANRETGTTYDRLFLARNGSWGNQVLGLSSNVSHIATDMNNMTFHTVSDLGVTGTSLPTNERMRINSSGQLGIGTASPAFLLDVNGTVRLSSNTVIDAYNGSFGAVTAGSTQTLTLTEVTDRLGEFVTSSFTVTLPGYYEVVAQANASQTGGTGCLLIKLNGSSVAGGESCTTGPASATVFGVHTVRILNLSASDVVRIDASATTADVTFLKVQLTIKRVP